MKIKNVGAGDDMFGIGAGLEVGMGYDHTLQMENFIGDTDEWGRLYADADLVELADMMIARWQQFKAKYDT